MLPFYCAGGPAGRGRGVTRGGRTRGAGTAGGRKLTFKTESDSDSELPPMSVTESRAQAASADKNYQPQTFAQIHIDDILKQNDELKVKVGKLNLSLF